MGTMSARLVQFVLFTEHRFGTFKHLVGACHRCSPHPIQHVVTISEGMKPRGPGVRRLQLFRKLAFPKHACVHSEKGGWSTGRWDSYARSALLFNRRAAASLSRSSASLRGLNKVRP